MTKEKSNLVYLLKSKQMDLLQNYLPLDQNQSKRARGECKRGGFFFHPSDENMSPGTPVEGKSHFAALPLGTATLVLL